MIDLRTLNDWAVSWWQTMGPAAWQAAVVGSIALVAIAFGRRWPAPLRHGILVLAMIKFALPPFAAVPLGIFSQFELSRVTVNSQRANPAVELARSDMDGGTISERWLPFPRNVPEPIPVARLVL
jgi:hypothetical protein